MKIKCSGSFSLPLFNSSLPSLQQFNILCQTSWIIYGVPVISGRTLRTTSWTLVLPLLNVLSKKVLTVFLWILFGKQIQDSSFNQTSNSYQYLKTKQSFEPNDYGRFTRSIWIVLDTAHRWRYRQYIFCYVILIHMSVLHPLLRLH